MKELIRENLHIFKDLAEKFKTYQNVAIDLKRIIYFIAQFRDPVIAKSIIELLKKIDFLDSNKVTYLLKIAYEKIDKALLTNPLICPLGSIQDSSALVCNKLIKKLFEDEKSSLNYFAELSRLGTTLIENRPTCIVFFDDNITSGTQLKQFFHELIDGVEEPEIVREKLTHQQVELLQGTPIKLCFAIKLDDSCDDKIRAIREMYNLDIELLYGKADLNNHLDFGASTFSTVEENDRTKEHIMKIAKNLYENKEWSKDTLYSRLIGYGNLGKLTVFYHNIPKSLIPIFWKFGTYNGTNWIPLFPESKEADQMERSGTQMDNYLLELIDVWISETQDNRMPELIHGFWLDGQVTNSIEIPIPTEEIFRIRYLNNIKRMTVKPTPDTRKSINEMSASEFYHLARPLENNNSHDYYTDYLAALEKYNAELTIYRNSVIEYIKRYIHSGEAPFVIKNIGTKSATNVKLEFCFDSGELVIVNFRDVPKPKFNKKKPELGEYKPGLAIIRSNNSSDFSISNFFAPKRQPYEMGNTYELKKNWDRIGHNDKVNIDLDVHQINTDSFDFQFSYELNYDEEIATIKNTLSISFVPSDSWKATREFDKEVTSAIKDLTERF